MRGDDHVARMANPNELGRKLHALRLAKGITQAEAAEAIGMARPSLAGIERGHDMPGRALMAAIAEFYSVSLDYLEGRPGTSGQQDTFETTQTEQEAVLLRVWRLLDKAQRASLIGIMEGLVGVPGRFEHKPSKTMPNSKQ